MTVRVLPGPGDLPERPNRQERSSRRERPNWEERPDLAGGGPGFASPPGPPMIELRGLLLRGQRQLAGARRLDLGVWPGELVMLTGQPRSGRSELLHVLGLLDQPAAGSYLLNGIDTAKLGDRDRSALRGRQLGLVFQRKMLLPTRSVLDNVILPLRYTGVRRRDRISAAMAALARTGIADRAELMTWQLSADELALCAIARALVTQPSLLLCDDPTAGVGQEAATRVISLLASLHREGKTVLIATADQLVAAYSSRSIELSRPTVSLTGPPIELPSATAIALAQPPTEPQAEPPAEPPAGPPAGSPAEWPAGPPAVPQAEWPAGPPGEWPAVPQAEWPAGPPAVPQAEPPAVPQAEPRR